MVALVILGTLLTGCSWERPSELVGVRSVSVDSFYLSKPRTTDSLNSMGFTDAVLRGPHYTLAIAWVAIGEQLDDQAANLLRIDPVRAAPGEQLLIAAVDPAATYSPFSPGPDATVDATVRVEAVVDGTATTLDRLPLRVQNDLLPAVKTELILISALPEAQVQLRVTDAGRDTALDLRTGKPIAAAGGGMYLQRQSEASWAGEAPVAPYRFGRWLPASLTMIGTLQKDGRRPLASVTTYYPEYGWAAPGRAFLSVPAPALISSDVVMIGLHEEFDDAAVFTFRTPNGEALPARPFMRDLGFTGVNFFDSQPPVTFDVPDNITAGTVFFDLTRAQLTEEIGPGSVQQAPAERRPISWALPPKVFELPLEFQL